MDGSRKNVVSTAEKQGRGRGRGRGRGKLIEKRKEPGTPEHLYEFSTSNVLVAKDQDASSLLGSPQPLSQLPKSSLKEQTPMISKQQLKTEIDKEKGAVSKRLSKVTISSEITFKSFKPVVRPDDGGTVGRSIQLCTNFYPMKFNKNVVVYHYDIDIEPDVKSKVRIREVMNYFVRLNQVKGGIFHNVIPVFDGRKNVYTAKKLLLKSSKPEFGFNMVGERRPFTLKIQLANVIPLCPMWEFLNGRSRDPPLEAIQALDIVLREMPTSRFFPIGRYFFTNPTDESMGPGLELWKGYYQSVRPTQWKILMLQLDTSVRVFHKGQHMLNLVMDFFRLRDIDDVHSLKCHDWTKFQDHIKGLAIQTTHQAEVKRTYKIISVSKQPANQLKFPLNQPDGSEIPCIVSDYFRKQYNIVLKYPYLPCLQAQPKEKHRFLPMEFCVVKKGQQLNKLTDELTTKLIRTSAVPAPDRQQQINEVVRTLQFDKDIFMREFNLELSPQMVQLDGRVLPPPRMQYENSLIEPRNGSWNMSSSRFYKSASIEKMAVISFHNIPDHVIQKFVKDICNASKNMGMFLPSPCDSIRRGRSVDDVGKIFSTLVNKHERALQLVIVILPTYNSAEFYGTIKKVGDTELGVSTQCIQPKNVMNYNPQILANICMKINAKLGAVNTIVELKIKSYILTKPVMIMGADTTHPAPGDTSKPSIAAVTASYDSTACKYAAKISIQKHREEIISNLQIITRELLLNFFKKTNGKKPEKIVFYRDGVSEGQFREVLAYELRAVQEACTSLEAGYQPLITFLVVQKRHHARFFCRNRADMQGRSKNVPAGTTVDKIIVHPVEFDFYLCSHEGIQGTSRPAHYHVLYDDNDFTSDELQKLTYHLCHVYARCTRSVSIPAPAYYAHHCASRGRHYLDSNIETVNLPQRDTEMARVLKMMNSRCLTHSNITGMFFA